MGGVSDYSYKYNDPLELYARVTKDYYLTTPNPVPADYLIDVKPVDKPHGSGIDSKKFHSDVGVVGLPSDVGHEYDESAPRELVISIDSLLDSISLQLAYEGGSSVELSSAHGSIRFYTSSDEILYLDYVDGNVGIGTMSPLYKLDVVGVARFSDSVKVGEYWLPKEIGSMSQVLTVDSTGKLVWMSVRRAYALDTTTSCLSCTSEACEPWLLDNDVLFTAHWESYGQTCTTAYYGIAKGNAYDTLVGIRRTFVNLGVSSRTGDAASDSFCTVTGGSHNRALGNFSTIGGGSYNEVGAEYGFIGGGSTNKILRFVPNYSVIVGGYNNNIGSAFGSIVGGTRNKIESSNECCFIGNGESNIISTINSDYSIIVGGKENEINSSSFCAIVDGEQNNILNVSNYSFIGSGKSNRISSSFGTIVCGESNIINSPKSFIGSGFGNSIDGGSDFSSIVSGYRNNINNSSSFSVIGGGLNDTVNGIWSGVFCGDSNVAGNGPEDTAVVIAGGYGNRITEKFSAICGGDNNFVKAEHSFIGGGKRNIIWAESTSYAVICGGEDNWVKGKYSGVIAGKGNEIYGDYSLVFGKDVCVVGDYKIAFFNSTNPGFVGINNDSPAYALDVNGTVSMLGFYMPTGASSRFVLMSDSLGNGRWQPISAAFLDQDWVRNPDDPSDIPDSVLCSYSTGADNTGYLGLARGGAGNKMSGNVYTQINWGVRCETGRMFSTVGGGEHNKATGDYATIAGGGHSSSGLGNIASGSYSTIGGGYANTAEARDATVGGGDYNNVKAYGSNVAGGHDNDVYAKYSVCAGGYNNKIFADSTDSCNAILGGRANHIDSTVYSVILGGDSNVVAGNYSLAFGKYVTVNDSFVAAFYSTSHPGKLKITNVLHLTPRNGPPPSPQEGDIYYDGILKKLRYFDGTNWHDL